MNHIAKILVADDNPTNRAILVGSLQKAGYEVFTADDGFQALEAVTQHQPDLILLDVLMPQRDGFEVCTMLKSQVETAAIPVIFVTAMSDADQVLKAFDVGACDFITKPFRSDEVLARVSTHVRLRQAELELRLRNTQLEELTSELATLSRTDPLTQLLNRRVWEQVAREEHERYKRHDSPYSIVMIDVDYFKAFNDSCGHQAGDECLQRIAQSISSVCRTVDRLGRYGGEEFVILAPQTHAEQAVKFAERVRKAVWALGIGHPGDVGTGRVTISLGVAECASSVWEEVLKHADDALYVAKRAGRNMVYSADGTIEKAAIGSATCGPSGSTVADGTPSIPKVCVLVVDDEETNRVLCRACLQRAGFEVRQAVDGLSAIASVEEAPPDVIIMDVMMPNMDGLECTKKLKADPDTRAIPIVMVSALTGTEDLKAGFDAGADEYMAKPIRTTELTLRVRSLARSYRERMDLFQSNEVRGEYARILTRLVEFCRAASSSRCVDEIAGHTLATVAEVAHARRVSIMFPDEEERRLRIIKSLGMDAELADTIRVPIGEPIAGQVFASGKPVLTNSDADVAPSRYRNVYDSRFFASVPLLSAPLGTPGGVIGVLNVTERIGGRPFKPYEVGYIELIASIAAGAVHEIASREAHGNASDSIMVALAKLAEHRDSDGNRHLDRVTQYTCMLAEQLRKRDDGFQTGLVDACPSGGAQIDDAFMRDLARAVPLHDIGKVAIPDHILLHPGKLTADQMVVMRTHAEAGAKTLRALIERSPGVGFLEMAADVAYNHHERPDGSGYPRGLQGDAIPLSARITALADVYDALTTKRVYRDQISHDKAVAIIVEASGTQFDPAVVDAFVEREKDFASLAASMHDQQIGECALSTEESTMGSQSAPI